MQTIPIEKHPLGFFLPENTRILMLGSFPPKKEKWSMNFYYPNIQNDMWRMIGLLFYNNKEYFLAADIAPKKKAAFDAEKIKAFCLEKGIALGDTALEIKRLKDNASDQFLEIVRPLNFAEIFKQIPYCNTIIVTGEKAMKTLLAVLESDPNINKTTHTTPSPSGLINSKQNKVEQKGVLSEPKVGDYISITYMNRSIKLYRMPSTSRAYPKPLEEKAAYYKTAFAQLLN